MPVAPEVQNPTPVSTIPAEGTSPDAIDPTALDFGGGLTVDVTGASVPTYGTSPDAVESYTYDPTALDFGGGLTVDVTGQTAANYGLDGQINVTREESTAQNAQNYASADDWRVRISLASSPSNAGYLYNASSPGILAPLQKTNGVIFPYTPSITTTYEATYDDVRPVHSNYRIYQYQNSLVSDLQLNSEFTAQDIEEAQYLLAVIHFFKSATKMFYGQDQNPSNGVPPPLCYLSGLGTYQYNNHPVLIRSFTYLLPNDVDYIAVPVQGNYIIPGQSRPPMNMPSSGLSQNRLDSGGNSFLSIGGIQKPTFFTSYTSQTTQPTYVPTKLQINLTLHPVVSRNDISNNFSLRDYASGALLRGKSNKNRGIW